MNQIAQNPKIGEKPLSLMKDHGETGNNWLNVFFKHSDRLMFGTDALAVGTKSHGESAYATNTKILYPMYNIFQAVGDALEEGKIVDQNARGDIETGLPPRVKPENLHRVVKNIAQDTFDDFFENPAMEARRAAYEQHLVDTGNEFTAPLGADRIAPGGDSLGAALKEVRDQPAAASSSSQPAAQQASTLNPPLLHGPSPQSSSGPGPAAASASTQLMQGDVKTEEDDPSDDDSGFGNR